MILAINPQDVWRPPCHTATSRGEGGHSSRVECHQEQRIRQARQPRRLRPRLAVKNYDLTGTKQVESTCLRFVNNLMASSEMSRKLSIESIYLKSSEHRQVRRRREIGVICIFLSCSFLFALKSVSCNTTDSSSLLPISSPLEAPSQPPIRITIQPNDLIAIEGESAELNCDAEGSPEPAIEWYHNGQLIKSSSHSRTTMGGSIQFLDIRPAASSPPPRAQSQQSTTTSNASQSSQRQQQQQASDAGTYHCLARNQYGEARSRNATLQVAYIKEKFRVVPRDKAAAIGDTVTFNCLPQAWPEPRISWRHNGRLIELAQLSDGSAKYAVNKIAKTDYLNTASLLLNGQQQSQMSEQREEQRESNGSADDNAADNDNDHLVDIFGSQLVIKQVDKSDEGTYNCLVETKGSHRLIERESPSAHLTASIKPFFLEAPEPRVAQVGGQVQLKCRMGGDPEPVISWRRENGQPLSEKVSIDPTDKTLILNGVKLADEGTYICEGENSAGSARAMAQVSVQSRPKFIVQPTDQEIETAGRVQLKCSGEASPAPILFWYKEGHRQLMFPLQATSSPNMDTMSSSSNSKLPSRWPPPLPSLQPQAAALAALQNDYSPSSSMTTTSDTSPAINKLFTMPLNPDHFTQQSTYQSNYFGNRIYVDSQGTLNIVNATPSDTGYYACALISSVGSVMAKAKLTVRPINNQLGGGAQPNLASTNPQDPLQAKNGAFTPTGISKYDLLPLPVIKMGTANQTLPTNTSTTLLCEVVSQVAYKIQWLFDTQILQEDAPRVLVLESGALSINNLKTSDSGIYTCVVTPANDQYIPLANPYEPLDSSMLTSAPPVQQSTSHSCMLKVANPINPNIQFFKMDIYAYPSSPGPAYMVSTNGEDAITIAWSPPGDAGVLPIRQYVVEHYDTSQEHMGWRVIHRPNGKEALRIDGLSSEGSHFFVIRATNSHGTGPSSAIAGPMRTVAGEARYQQEFQRRNPLLGGDLPENRPDTNLARDRLMGISTTLLGLTPVSSNSIRLQWSTQTMGNLSGSLMDPMNYSPMNSPGVGDFLEGFSIRYRAVGIGESLLGKDLIFGSNWNSNFNSPASLPLVTSFIDEEEGESGGAPQALAYGSSRSKRDITQANNYFDFSQEFNEVRVADHSTEHYTINRLRPFTLYQFFVVPYYKDIDGVPSNILSAQTNEDRPSVAPPNLTIRSVNNTSIRLLWLNIPPIYANGILRGYVVRINRSDIMNTMTGAGTERQTSVQSMSMAPKMLNLPLSSLLIAPLTAFNPESKLNPNFSGIQQQQSQQYVVMYDITNLTYKSFYSVQVAGLTSLGPGPWSEAQNFVMDPKILANQMRISGDEFQDVMSKSLISSVPQSYESNNSQRLSSAWYIVIGALLVIVSILLIVGFLIHHQRNNQKVITWKKTISEHFTNKFYMPSAADHHHPHRNGPNSMPQNIYDHQQHLIYSAGSTHMSQHPSGHHQHQWAAATAVAANNNATCINSSGTGSVSSHGGLLPIGSDPNSLHHNRVNNDQILIMNNKDPIGVRGLIRGPNLNGQLINQSSAESTRSLSSHQQQQQHGSNQHHLQQQQPSQQQQQIIHHGGDYYSVINNVAEYEELDPHQRNQIQLVSSSSSNVERHQTGSSNSDTSCPSSVTRLLPNQNYNRDLLGRGGFVDNHQRQDMILQQQISCTADGKQQQHHQPFVTMINGSEAAKFQSMKSPLSPYATTNLMSQQQQQPQLFANPQMNLIDQPQRQQAQQLNYLMHNGTSTLDDSSKIFMAQQQQQVNGQSNPLSAAFLTLQRNPTSFQQRGTPMSQMATAVGSHHPQHIFMQTDVPANGANQQQFSANNNHHHQNYVLSPFHQGHNQMMTNITPNPCSDLKSNLYEHIDYSGVPRQNSLHQMVLTSGSDGGGNNNTQLADIISSSTSSGSVKSPPSHQQSSIDQQSNGKFKRGSGGINPELEGHDLRVFSSAHVSRPSDCGSERARLTGGGGGSLLEEQEAEVDSHSRQLMDAGDTADDLNDEEQIDETTAFRQKSCPSDNQRTRQLSKRKRQQQRNRLHNNQNIS